MQFRFVHFPLGTAYPFERAFGSFHAVAFDFHNRRGGQTIRAKQMAYVSYSIDRAPCEADTAHRTPKQKADRAKADPDRG